MKLASFDIFDTCLIRKCGYPNNIFFLLSRRLYPESVVKQESFLNWRLEAEKMVRLEMNKSHPTIEDIYCCYPTERFSEYNSQYVRKCELKIERQNLYRNELIVSTIKEKRSKGFVIAFISDMYLDSYFIRGVLEKEGVSEPYDRIYISSEYGVSKSDGMLFERVRKDLMPDYWCHYGDNKRSDYINAKKKGIDAYLIENTGYTPIEQYILNKYKAKRMAYLYGSFIGVLRFARISLMGNRNVDIIEFSADVAVPICLAFVLDVLSVSKREGIKRLYFLARDSWILYYMAQMLNSQESDVKLKYLYVSRKSLYLPTIDKINRRNIERCFGLESKNLSINKVVEYFKLNEYVDYSLYNESEIRNSASSKLDELFALINNKHGYRKLEQHIKNEQQNIKDYFYQEGLFDDILYAFVDVGWKGSGLNALNLLQQKFGIRPAPCFYWHTFKRCRNYFPVNFYTHNPNVELPKYFISFVEDYLSANPQLSTIGYKTHNGQTVPLFAVDSRIDNEEIAETNKTVSNRIIMCLSELGLRNEASDVLAEMEETLLYALIHKPYYFKFSALSFLKYFSEEEGTTSGLSVKISLAKTFKYILGGDIHELWAEACICYTYPQVGKYLIGLHHVSNKILRLFRQKLHL